MGALVIAIANCKGGTGKTTTAVNLAAELAHLERRVLLVDLDSQGHSGLGFGVSTERHSATAHKVFRQSGVDLSASIRRTAFERVHVVPADREFTIPAAANDPHRLAEALAPLKDRYDVVLIDTPPAADLPLVAALTAAHCVLVPTQLTHLAHDGLVQFSRHENKPSTADSGEAADGFRNPAGLSRHPDRRRPRRGVRQRPPGPELPSLLAWRGGLRLARGRRCEFLGVLTCGPDAAVAVSP
jgi:molybdopterin-guanine dinucleotide biosynthesis protein